MSVTGPQNRLTQYTGVEKTATMGRWVASAAAMVEWCSSGSGTVPSDARESIALGGTSLAPSVWFCVGSAASPGAGMAWRLATMNAPLACCIRRAMLAVTWTCQIPARSNATVVAYTPRPVEASTSVGWVGAGVGTWVPGMTRNVPFEGGPYAGAAPLSLVAPR